MPDATSNIYVETESLVPMPGTSVLALSYELNADDNIGIKNIPAVYRYSSTAVASSNLPSEFQIDPHISGSIGLDTYFITQVADSGMMDIPAEYNTPTSPVDTVMDVSVDFSSRTSFIYGVSNMFVGYITGQLYEYFTQIPLSYWDLPPISGSVLTDLEYVNFTEALTSSGTPIAFYTNDIDILTEYNALGIGGSASVSSFVDVTFAGWISSAFGTHVLCAISGSPIHNRITCSSIDGGVAPIYCSTTCAGLSMYPIDSSCICSRELIHGIQAHSNVISGSVNHIDIGVISSDLKQTSLSISFGLYPIEIRNFSLSVGDYVASSHYISVDVLDCINGISVSGTGVYVDSSPATVTYSGIDCGYRLYYNTDDLPAGSSTIEFLVRAENNVGQTLTNRYYLTLGYIVEYDNTNDLDYGHNNLVSVRVSASNNESCTVFDAYSYWFGTRGLYNNALGCCINGIGTTIQDQHGDLTASLTPLNIFYEYGKSFDVEINVSDNSGNMMPTFRASYRIEDKP